MSVIKSTMDIIEDDVSCGSVKKMKRRSPILTSFLGAVSRVFGVKPEKIVWRDAVEKIREEMLDEMNLDYSLVCDESNNPPEKVEQGILTCEVRMGLPGKNEKA